jgi:hypothetical protein
MRETRFWAALALVGCLGLAVAQPLPTAPPQPLPTFAQLQAAGARFGQITTVTEDVFDTSDPLEDKLLFRWANVLHIQTRAGVIARALAIKTGDPITVQAVEETERLLRSNRYLYDVQLRVVAVQGDVADVQVSTRDTWSIDAGASVGRAGGASSSGVTLKDQNFLGTGMLVALGRSKTVDRTGTELQVAGDRVFGTELTVNLSMANNSDGKRSAASVSRPFSALDSRWAAGVSAMQDDRIDAVYRAGKVVSQYRQLQDQADVFVGWSAGLQDGWAQRYTVGLQQRSSRRSAEPGLLAPPQLAQLGPGNSQREQRVAPYLRYSLLQDRYSREQNRNVMGRPEFVALGLAATLELGWASKSLGSTDDVAVYSFSVSQGLEPAPGHTALLAATAAGELGAASTPARDRLGVQLQYHWRQSPRWLFYAFASADTQHDPDPATTLQLGGDSGLRGYPLRYQSGSRRVLLTLEERHYSDLYLWRLFRVGSAVFFDAGRAWGSNPSVSLGPTPHPNPGWQANAGAGLRIVSTRSAFSNVLHIDLAFPLAAAAGIKKTQLLVKTKASF